jgi:putative glycosyltransferase (TIGR04372 family)
MDHLLVRLPGCRALLADVHRSADGHGVGYGMMLIRMRKALTLGRALDVPVFLVPSRRALNMAVARLESDEVQIVRAESWRGRGLLALWWLAAPFRVGNPSLWALRSIAAAVVGPFYEAVERSRRLPRRVRRLLMRGGHHRWLKGSIAAYTARSDARWKRLAGGAAEADAPIRLRLPAGVEPVVEREAARLGIDPGRRIVTVHVREGGYRSTAGLRQRGWDESRNARIETFLPAFAALAARGYTIVRLGDPTMTPVAQPGVVDLATRADRSPWLEIWCTMRSDFTIGCDSGPSWLAVLLGVPVLTVNAVHFRDLVRPADRVVCKLARDTATGQLLSVSEMLTPAFLKKGFKDTRYQPVDNDPDDIEMAALDMIEVVGGRERLSWPQKRFNQRLLDVDRWKLGGSSALDGVAVIGRSRGTLARRFAKRHFERADSGERPA